MDKKITALPKVVIHAGRHKTGTTSIQGFLGINEEVLAEKYNILYTATGRNKDKYYHHPIFKGLVTFGDAINKEQIQAIVDEAIEKKCHTILLSSEMLSRPNLSMEQLLAVKEAFPDHDISIVLYLRRQDDFHISRYAERVKNGLLKSPETIENIDKDTLNYFSFVERYSAVFGKESIVVRSFDKCKGKGLYKDFLSALNIEMNENDFMMPDKILNTRYSWRHIEMIRLMGRFGFSVFFAKNKIVLFLVSVLNKKFPEFMGKPKPMSEEQALSLYETYRGSNKKLEQEYLNGEKLFE